MNLLTNKNSVLLWQETVRQAEDCCHISLNQELETYLVSLLIDYSNKPEVTDQVFANAFLEAKKTRNNHSLRQMGDQCLLFAGLFPHVAEKKLVKISYFVDIGRSAYISISSTTNDLFQSLAFQFVTLMDVLQSIRPYSDLLPIEAYEQWSDVGSQRALRILREYTKNSFLPK